MRVGAMKKITLEQALAALEHPFLAEDGDRVIHAFLGTLGADWSAQEVEDELVQYADRIYAAVPGSMAWALGHRVVIPEYTAKGTALAFATRSGAFE